MPPNTLKTISLISQKGGSGKTTLALHLAVCAHLAGLSTVVLDLDQQGSAGKWSLLRARAKGVAEDDLAEPEVHSSNAALLAQQKSRLQKAGAQILIIDTPPTATEVAQKAAQAADLVLVPCRPSAHDLQAVSPTVDMLTKLVRRPFHVVLSSAPPVGSATQDAIDYFAGQKLPVAPQIIHQRAAFVHSATTGETASEYEPGGKADQEVQNLFAWVQKELGIGGAA